MQYKGVVEIVKKLDKICLFYLKNQDFIDLAKTKGYRWNEDDCCWYRRLNEETGKYPDRASEIGHELLRNGYAICIHDAEITEKAITGEYLGFISQQSERIFEKNFIFFFPFL